MLTFHKILFPVDFSSRCIETTHYVAEIARKFQSDVVLIHVLGIYNGMPYGAASPTVAYAAYTAAYPAYEDTIRQHRIDALETFGQQDLSGLNVTRTVEVGEPATTIVHSADAHQVDLIVMPTHSQGRFRRLLLGSVTAKVLHDTERPVWTTAHSEALACHASEEIRSVICAVDLGSEGASLVRAASDIATRYGAAVKLVHAVPSPEFAPNGIIEDAPFQRFLFDRATERMADLQREAQTNFEICIKHGRVADVIREAAENYKSQLVVIGRGHITEFLGRFRTNVNAIIRESPCPVLSI